MERAWWENVLRVLVRPREVFAAFRDDSDDDADAADARVEPINVIVGLAAVSAVSWSPETGRLFSDPAIDGLLVAVLLVLSGALYGVVGYFFFGWLAKVGLATVGVRDERRRPRQMLAYALTPVAASIVLLVVRLALYGGDVFERGAERGSEVLGAVFVATIAWSIGLLALGLRTVYDLDWSRAVAAVLLPAFVPAVAIASVLT